MPVILELFQKKDAVTISGGTAGFVMHGKHAQIFRQMFDQKFGQIFDQGFWDRNPVYSTTGTEKRGKKCNHKFHMFTHLTC